MTTVRELLARKGSTIVTVLPSQTVLDAAQLMNARGIGAVLVTEGGRLAGIFTERDLMRRVVAEQRDPSRVTLLEVMTTRLVTTRPEMGVEECAGMMTTQRIRHLPVLENEVLVGIVTIGDILAYQVSEQASTIAQLNSYVFDVR